MMAPFTTARLNSRPLELLDAPRIEELINDFDIARMLASVPYPYPRGGAKDFITKIQPGHEVFAICLQDGSLIGCISFCPEESDMQFGYWLGKAFWGKGYMSEAAKAFLHRIFSELGLDKVTTSVFADNPASWRLQEKLGFRRKGDILVYSAARGRDVPSWKTELNRKEFLKS